MKLYQTLKELCDIVSVSGGEEKMAAYIQAHMTPFCDETELDAMGNLICKRTFPGAKETLLFCAHMDEIGFLVTDAEEHGFVFLAPIGGIREQAAAFSRVRFENGRVGNLVPPHDTKPSEMDRTKFVCDIGAKTREGALRLVKPGDRCATVSALKKLSGSRISARALDNRLGVCALLKCAEALADRDALPYNLVFLFSVQEEVGLRGAGPAAFATQPDYCINVDVTHANDAYGAKGPVKLGGGCAIKYKDRSVVCHRRMIRHLTDCAAQAGIPTQTDILTLGGTDTGAIQSSRAGVVSGAVSLPLRYMHTDCESADLSDLSDAVRLLCAAAETEIR